MTIETQAAMTTPYGTPTILETDNSDRVSVWVFEKLATCRAAVAAARDLAHGGVKLEGPTPTDLVRAIEALRERVRFNVLLVTRVVQQRPLPVECEREVLAHLSGLAALVTEADSLAKFARALCEDMGAFVVTQ